MILAADSISASAGNGISMRNLSLIAAVAALFLQSSYASAAGIAAAQTKVVAFKPAAMKITSSVRGHCWTTSIASRRSDAYRCMVANSIYDPCFSSGAKTVACPTDVAANSGVRITLTRPLPQSNTGNVRNAWMMQLAGGAKCNMGTGTVIPQYPFYCTGNLVCAAPASSQKPPVFVQCGRPKNGMSVTGTGHYLVTAMYE